MRTILGLIVLIAAGYVALTLLMYFMQERIVFQPRRGITSTPANVGLAYEDVWLTTSDGERLHAWWVPHPEARATLLLLHGNAGNLSGRVLLLPVFHGLGLNVLIPDYRGYGRSTGRPTEDGLYRDGDAAWQHLTASRAIDPGEIVIHGRSLGAGVATWLAERTRPGAVVLESAFTSVPDVAADHYPILPVRLLSRISFDSLSRIGQIHVPLLVIHSPSDEIVPFTHGERLFEAANEPKQFLRITGGHNDGFFVSESQYVRGLDAFLTQFVARAKRLL